MAFIADIELIFYQVMVADEHKLSAIFMVERRRPQYKTSWLWTELPSPSYSNHALKKTAVNNEPKFGKKIERKVSMTKSSWNTVVAIRKHSVVCEISWMTKFSSKLISKWSHYRDDEYFHHLIQCMIPLVFLLYLP